MRRPIRAILLTTVAGLAVWSAQAATPTLTGADVGTPSMPGSLTTTNDANGKPVIVVTGGGSDIWGTADSFYYAYLPITGDFDYVVKVSSLTGNSGDGGWSKAELMARLDDGGGIPGGGDLFIANMVTRPSSDTANSAPAGSNNRGPQWRAIRDQNCTWTAPNPAYPPNTGNNWMRLERVGSTFYMYTSDDGKAWKMFNPYDPQGWDTADSWPPGADNADVAFFTNAWPATIFLGLAVTAHNDGDVSTATFTDFGPYTPAAIVMSGDLPATVNVSQNAELALSVTATGDPVHYQWFRNGSPIARAVGPAYNVALAQPSDAGTYKVRVFGGGKEIMSRDAVVTVTVDTTAPTVASITPDASFTSLRVNFSEPVGDSALTAANYALDQGVTISSVARVDADTVTLTTSKLAEGTAYTLTINGVKDTAAQPNTIAADTKVAFKSLVFLSGLAIYERWDNANGDPGAIAAFATAVKDGNLRNSDVTRMVSQFGAPWGVADNYSSRVSGWFVPPSSGEYIFFVSSDDACRLYLATDEKPANKKWIAQETGWSNQYQWLTSGDAAGVVEDKRSDLFTGESGSEWPTPNVINLTAGKKYYLELLHDEGGGGDGADATFVKVGDPDPETTANGMKLRDSSIGAYVDVNGASVTFTQQPQSVTAVQSGTATFTAAATGASIYGSTVSYQWEQAPKGGTTFTAISGATSASYTTPVLTLADDGTQFRVVASVPGVPVTSSVATLSINSDATAPAVVSAGLIKNTAKVGVAFSELMDTNSAQTAANYTVSGATVSSAALRHGKYVELTLGGNLATAPSVSLKGVKDLAGNPVADTTVTAELVNMVSTDIGEAGVNPLQPGYGVAFGGGSFFVAGGGADIWDSADGCHFVYQEFTGAFDARVRVESMDASGLSTWAKAELMVREGTEAGARHNSVCVTRPSPAGENAVEAQWRDNTDGTSGNARVLTPVPYPNAWLRLVREDAASNDIKLYISQDGVNWTLANTHATAEPVLPAKLLIGMAVTSHDNSGNDELAEGLYRSFSVQPYTPVFDPQLRIGFDRASGKVSLTWTSGTLVSSPTVNGTYTPVTGAASPYAVTPSGITFYRIAQ